MFETVKTDVFIRSFFEAKSQEIDSMMVLSSILESFWEPSWLTYSLLVAPVTKIADMVDTFFQTRKNGFRFASREGGRGW